MARRKRRRAMPRRRGKALGLFRDQHASAAHELEKKARESFSDAQKLASKGRCFLAMEALNEGHRLLGESAGHAASAHLPQPKISRLTLSNFINKCLK